MTKKNSDKELLVVSEIFTEASDVEKRYKALKKTIKNIKKFNEVKLKGPIAEA
ncbi:MAG TPA: hypothetical protein VN174_00725 [Candidatus Methanoperedens sp.]|nr:hypothetical protein [Candidatus Methanoperedens sp.]